MSLLAIFLKSKTIEWDFIFSWTFNEFIFKQDQQNVTFLKVHNIHSKENFRLINLYILKCFIQVFSSP